MQWYDRTAKNMKAATEYTRQQLISLLREDTPPLLSDGYDHWAAGRDAKFRTDKSDIN